MRSSRTPRRPPAPSTEIGEAPTARWAGAAPGRSRGEPASVHGDNEWTDCHRPNNGGYNPLERLAKVRATFFPSPGRTLGQHQDEGFLSGGPGLPGERDLRPARRRVRRGATSSAATTASPVDREHRPHPGTDRRGAGQDGRGHRAPRGSADPCTCSRIHRRGRMAQSHRRQPQSCRPDGSGSRSASSPPRGDGASLRGGARTATRRVPTASSAGEPCRALDTTGERWHDAAMDTGKAEHEARALEEVVERLVGRFPDVAEDRVRETVRTAHQEFADRPIRDFVPVFVERAARTELSRSTTE